MKNLEILGLKKEDIVVKELHQYLADLHVFYANVRGYHWNIKGTAFFALHTQFENLYNALAECIDDVAERLLQLNETPENHLDVLASTAKLSAKGHPEEPKAMVNSLLEDFKYIIAATRKLCSAADDVNDITTHDLIAGFLPELEKKVWMFNAYCD